MPQDHVSHSLLTNYRSLRAQELRAAGLKVSISPARVPGEQDEAGKRPVRRHDPASRPYGKGLLKKNFNLSQRNLDYLNRLADAIMPHDRRGSTSYLLRVLLTALERSDVDLGEFTDPQELRRFISLALRREAVRS